MSLILTQWLNENELLEQTLLPLDLDRTFSSGYQFGKLLDSLGLQDNFETTFIDSTTIDALLQNYISLEATMRRKFDFKLTSLMAIDLINTKNGATAKMLYQIKTSFDLLPKSRDLHKPERKEQFDSYPSASVGTESTLNQSSASLSNQISPFDLCASQQFAAALKRKLNRLSQFIPKSNFVPVSQELPPIQKIYSQSTARLIAAPALDQKSYKSFSSARLAPSPRIEPKSHKSHSSAILLSPPAVEQRSYSIAKLVNPLQMELKPKAQDSTLHKKKIPKIQQSSQTIDAFETKLQDLSNSKAELTADQVKQFLSTTANMSPTIHMEELQRAFIARGSAEKGAAIEYLDRIKMQRHDLELAQKQQSRNNTKNALIRQQIKNDIDQNHANELINSEVLIQTEKDRIITLQSVQKRSDEDAVSGKREAFDERYAALRQTEYEESLKREHELYVGKERGHVGIEMDRHFEMLKIQKSEEKEDDILWIGAITKEIVEMAFLISDYKTVNDCELVPFKISRKWALEIRSSIRTEIIPIAKPVKLSLVKKQETPEEQSDVQNTTKSLDANELDDYLHYNGDWQTAAKGLLKHNAGLAGLVEHLISLTKQPEPSHKLTPMSNTPLRIALIGKKFSGKSSLAAFIAKKYNMTILRLEDLVKDAVNQPDTTVKKKITLVDGKEPKKSLTNKQIGTKVQLALAEGQIPDDIHLVQLFVDAMNQDPECAGGWLLVDFPKTKTQCLLLEREISGYEDPKPVKKGEGKRGIKPRKKSATALEIAPEVIPGVPFSGLDAVIMLAVSNDTAIKRAAGQAIDPATGKWYHVESVPPPADALVERLSVVEDQARSMAQLHYHLATFDEEEENLKEWLNQFKILQFIDANFDLSGTEGRVETLLNDLVMFVNKQEKIEDGEDGTKARPSSGFWKRPTEDRKEAEVVVVVEKQPTKEMAQVLINQWIAILSKFTETMKFCFRIGRRLAGEMQEYYQYIRYRFQTTLNRPDVEHELISTFQREYNAIEDELRSELEVQAELFQRIDELSESLLKIADRKRDEVEIERVAMIMERWTEDRTLALTELAVVIIQAEADRFFSTRQFLIDYYKDSNGIAITEDNRLPVQIPFAGMAAPHQIEIDSVVPTNELSNMESNGQEFKSRATVHNALEGSNLIFPDINANVEYLQNLIQSPDYNFKTLTAELLLPLKEKKSEDKKIEPEIQIHVPVESIKFIEIEEVILSQRISRLQRRTDSAVQSMRKRSVDLFAMMDESIGARYASEINSCGTISKLFKEAIIECEKVAEVHEESMSSHPYGLDCDTEPGTRASTAKHLEVDFNVKQLGKLVKEFAFIAPSGIIPTKMMVEYFMKAGALGVGADSIPESYFGIEATEFSRMLAGLDPFETGFISWRKFIIFQSKILPVDRTYLQSLKVQYCLQPLDRARFLSIPLWFEHEHEPVPPLKRIIYEVFLTSAGFDAEDFLLTCCCGETPLAFEKAFEIMGESNGCNAQQLYDIYTHFLYFPRPAHRTSEEKVGPYKLHSLELMLGDQSIVSFKDFQKLTENEEWARCPLYELTDLSTRIPPKNLPTLA